MFDNFKRLGRRLGRRLKAPHRATVPYAKLVQLGQVGGARPISYRPTPRNLRYFARTVYARRAINAIKNPVAMADWEVGPIDGVELNKELERQIEVVTTCLKHPNADDNFRSLIEQIVEDILCGAGAIEQQISGDPLRPLWLYPVDGTTIHIFPGWAGEPDQARYVQIIGYGNYAGGGSQILLRNDELIYIRPNPTTDTPFGIGPLEIAFNSISRLLGVGEFAGNVATNARPNAALDLGDGVSPEYLSSFRSYWTNEIEGQGKFPIFGLEAGEKTRGPQILRFYPEGDTGLYLKWQEFLKSEIATAFDISPQNLGVERDVNRNTAEVAEDRDRSQAIKPMAHLVQSHITREAIHGKLGFSQLEFRFKGMDPEDEESLATSYEKLYRNNAILPDEHRARVGLPPMEGPWGKMTNADVQIAIAAARGAKDVIDPDLDKYGSRTPPKTKQEED